MITNRQDDEFEKQEYGHGRIGSVKHVVQPECIVEFGSIVYSIDLDHHHNHMVLMVHRAVHSD
ncbi:hypothetical protein DERP_014669 [Dermatophagoides pteronyssinus]|uniref:Uncharacterized protein n=1 Tax=Dermatophagoides pteronyssinus TaxID=6956 RepID=A0ABQ8JS45_DERPT|nr:hypothetical protein DERP_014669 [Dermatophagoides pteronyssinus]